MQEFTSMSQDFVEPPFTAFTAASVLECVPPHFTCLLCLLYFLWQIVNRTFFYYYQQWLSFRHSSIKARFAKCMTNCCHVDEFSHLKCGPLQFLQIFHGPLCCFFDWCSPCQPVSLGGRPCLGRFAVVPCISISSMCSQWFSCITFAKVNSSVQTMKTITHSIKHK